MTVVNNLNQAYVDLELRCPTGKAHTEFVDPQCPGLYIEYRASSPGKGTCYRRYKDAAGKTCHQRIGRTTT